MDGPHCVYPPPLGGHWVIPTSRQSDERQQALPVSLNSGPLGTEMRRNKRPQEAGGLKGKTT